MQYIPVISKSEELNKILKNHRDKKLGIPVYDQLSEKYKAQRQGEDLDTIIKSTRTALQSLQRTIEGDIKGIVKDLADTMYPAVTYSSTLMDGKIYCEEAYHNALETFREKPGNIEEKLKLGLEQGRYEFVFYCLDWYKNDASLSHKDSSKINRIADALDEQLGIKEKQERKLQLEQSLVETREYLRLLNEEYGKFEAKINSAVKVAAAMKESGQLESETILLS